MKHIRLTGRHTQRTLRLVMAAFVVCGLVTAPFSAFAQADDPSPPTIPVKLIFIHHSTGENWLSDSDGGLGRALGENNYFVSDTNYGWGPDGIGDRTDIPNWPEWFRGSDSDRILTALYNETGQHAEYTRTLSDPGGENQIVMFKSCFPNSNLDGNPGDPPSPGNDYTVGNAKYIYNDLLNYFSTRPDKLFVVITAPPVMDPTYSDNARAFNTWLVHDWLAENNYTQGNVVVWDFYNVLTGSDNHHRWNNGAVEYISNRGGNTAYYPTGDDHPSPEGNQKSTAEFVPMLNVFYNRWRANAPAPPPPEQPPAEPATEPTEEAPPPDDGGEEGELPPVAVGAAPVGILIDNFEGNAPQGSAGWEYYWEDGTSTQITCAGDANQAHEGSASMGVNFDIAANSWGTCVLFYDEPVNWSQGQGLSFDLHSAEPALIFSVIIYGGTQENQATYMFTVETTPESTNGWVHLDLPWETFLRADWEEGAGSPFQTPEQLVGVAFGFDTYPDTPNTGAIWVDNLEIMGQGAAVPLAAPPAEPPPAPAEQEPPPADNQPADTEQQPTTQEEQPPVQAEQEQGDERGRICSGGSIPVFMLVGLIWLRRKN